MCSFETVANNTNTSCKSSSSKKPQKLTLFQQWNQKTVFEDLQFLTSLLKYFDLFIIIYIHYLF